MHEMHQDCCAGLSAKPMRDNRLFGERTMVAGMPIFGIL